MAISKITSDAIDATGFNLDGNVGIGTAPSTKLDVLSSGATIARFKRDNTGGASGGISVGNNDKLFTLYSDNVGGLQFYEDSTERIRFQLGGGISFNGDSAAANALDDYEEGTWTPVFTPNTGSFSSITYTGDTGGRYIKIGQMVYLHGRIKTSAVNTSGASSYLKITGSPFAHEGGSGYMSFNIGYSVLGSDSAIGGLIHPTVNHFELYSDTSTGPNSLVMVSALSSTVNDVIFTATYRTST